MASWLEISVMLSYVGLLISAVMALGRLLLGPTLADRVVALDLICFITIGLIAVYTIDSGQEALLDIAITLGLVAFLGTVAFARLIFKRKGESEWKL